MVTKLHHDSSHCPGQPVVPTYWELQEKERMTRRRTWDPQRGGQVETPDFPMAATYGPESHCSIDHLSSLFLELIMGGFSLV